MIRPGSICWTEFPYSDLSQKKPRPVVVLKTLEHGDVIVCMVTSKKLTSRYAVKLNENFMCKGKPLAGSIRPDKLFTAHQNSLAKLTDLPQNKTSEIFSKLQKLFADPYA
ncbi:MAG: type II toxin-antitoxin system PemK/MazF family toxin [Desulfomicrobium sp.]|nr:type II toxin-antitoxin system PemK/MazF family toxin [Desulfomicrobium sp.]